MSKPLDFWQRLLPKEKDSIASTLKMTRTYISTILNGNDKVRINFSLDTAERFLEVAKGFPNGDSLVLEDLPMREGKNENN